VGGVEAKGALPKSLSAGEGEAGSKNGNEGRGKNTARRGFVLVKGLYHEGGVISPKCVEGPTGRKRKKFAQRMRENHRVGHSSLKNRCQKKYRKKSRGNP